MFKKIVLILILANIAFAFSLDKKVSKDESGWIGAHYNIPKYSFIALLGMATFEGSESRFGRTSFRAIDAGIYSQIATEGLKKATGRLRPRYTDSPSDWNEGGASFPSGHVSGMTAMVVPYILEYQDDYPLVHLLWAFPIHQMIGRIKAQAHWQSDVIAGVLVGYASGYAAHKIDSPLLLQITPSKVFVGLKYRF